MSAPSAPPHDDRPVALIGLPAYGQASVVSVCSVFAAGNRTRNRISTSNSSLLARAFNELWCSALNLRHRGERCDYFAMLHADVEPEAGWLDKLIAILEERQLDVLSAVVPIKSNDGLTSTAYTDFANPWRPLGRLTLSEVYRLPETFTSDDLPNGLELLLNTGCWVAKLGDWSPNVHFEINDRIRHDPEHGYVFECEPEDWHFSRQCHALGLRIGATRAVKLDHSGHARYGNVEPWGNPFDAAYRPCSILDPIPDWFPTDVPGWLTVVEGTVLREYAAGKRVLEIGSYCGRSTLCMAPVAGSVTCVDPFDGRATPNAVNTLATFRANLDRAGLTNVRPFVGTTRDFAGEAERGRYDFAFIDGDHTYESVRLDSETAAALLVPGGRIAFHDYESPADPGVTKAVNELLTAGWRLVERRASVAILEPNSKA